MRSNEHICRWSYENLATKSSEKPSLHLNSSLGDGCRQPRKYVLMGGIVKFLELGLISFSRNRVVEGFLIFDPYSHGCRVWTVNLDARHGRLYASAQASQLD